MRTTVTLDKDVEQMLRQAMHASRRSLKQTLNDAVRRGLRPGGGPRKARPFKVRARPLGLRTDIDPTSLNKLADMLESEALAAQLVQGERDDRA